MAEPFISCLQDENETSLAKFVLSIYLEIKVIFVLKRPVILCQKDAFALVGSLFCVIFWQTARGQKLLGGALI